MPKDQTIFDNFPLLSLWCANSKGRRGGDLFNIKKIA